MASILVVDDYPDACDLLARLLSRLGHTTTCAYSGAQALLMLGTVRPDAVLMDHMMPGMSGIEVLRTARADPRFAEVPIILFTAMSDEETRAEAVAAGATDYWVKPVQPGEVGIALERILGTPEQDRRSNARRAAATPRKARSKHGGGRKAIKGSRMRTKEKPKRK